MRKVLTAILATTSLLTACSHTNSSLKSKSGSSKSISQKKGMACIGPNIYVDQHMSAQQRSKFLKTVKQSKTEISQFFGGMKSSPDIYACSTKQCFNQFGGIPAKAKSINDNTVILSSKGLDKTTLTHELAHVEFHKRLGTPHNWNKVPMWFDEGLAVLACKDPNYSKSVPMMPLNKLKSQDQWVSAVRKKKPAYNIAKQAVETWYEGVGNKGLQDLIDRLKKGESFSLDNETKLKISRL